MYQALYRKYRPKNFDDVVGQKIIVETLKNSIINNKINHAYMFFGPRGIGKTTIAKVLARAVNCTDTKDGNPCGKCDNCVVSLEKECVDIIEIDAASNNGVDEIREIRSKVNLVPTKLKYKVYIIDEVHMLTQGAFNALLKTLEEPPKHVIFILATTDPQKVSDTIISRCQCFSFKRIAENENYERLKEISKKENINIDDDVLKQISIYSDGGLRDSLGLLDKLSSYKSGNITIEDFLDLNDMISNQELEEICQNVENKDVSSFINQMEQYYNQGKNIIEISNQLLIYLKNQIIDYYSNNKEVKNIEIRENLLKLINEKMFDIKKSAKPYVFVEILFLQFINNLKNISREIILEEKPQKIVEKEENIEDLPKKVEKNDQIESKDNKKSLSQNFMLDLMNIRVNNILAEADKKEKTVDVKKIEKLNDYIFDSNNGYLVSELLNGELRASSSSGIILSYEYDSVVEQNINNLNKLTDVYNKLTNSNKKLAFITDKKWQEEKKKYIEFTKLGNKYTIIDEPEIPVEINTEERKEDTSNMLELFGDIVEIK